MRIYLIRHGETDYNRDRIFQGHADIPLNATGIAQARRLAERIRQFPIEKIHASDIRRTMMTAEILSAAIGLPVIQEPLLRERNPGDLTHLSYDAGMAFFTDRAFKPANGESADEFDQRVQGAFERLIDLESNGTGSNRRHVAIVTHGMVCASFLRRLAGFADAQLVPIRWRNTSLTIADYDAGKWDILTLCDASHLDGIEGAMESEGAQARGAIISA